MNALSYETLAALAGNHFGVIDVACPLCGPGRPKKRSERDVLRLWCDAPGFIRYKCARCEAKGFGREHGTERAERPKRQPKPDSKEHERKQHAKAAALWRHSEPIGGTVAETYLRQARGITCALPATLRFLPAREGYHAALIAPFAFADEPEPGVIGKPRNVDSVHLTLIKCDGSGKAELDKPKLIVGSPRDRPIMIAPPNDLLGLAIAEGIEDALTVHQATRLGAWAAGAASFLGKLGDAVPSYVEAITIYAHSDKAGQDGARKLADALRGRGLEVFTEGL